MTTLLKCVLAVGLLISFSNFYLSFLRRPRKPGEASISIFPLYGSALIVLALLILDDEPTWVRVLAVFAAVVDTGGIHWFAYSMLLQWSSRD